MKTLTETKVVTGVIARETETLHRIARTTGFMRTLISGEASVHEYGEHLFNQYIVYQALEASLERFWFHPYVEPVYNPGLYRGIALENDLEAVVGPGWRNLRSLDSTAVYAHRIHELSLREPGLLAAHAYVLYSGVLAGSSVFRQILTDEYKLGPEAQYFYDFSHIEDVPAFTSRYRDSVGALPFREQEDYEFINEIKLSFVLNASISFEMEHRSRLAGERGNY
jgi:heme oxygenase